MPQTDGNRPESNNIPEEFETLETAPESLSSDQAASDGEDLESSDGSAQGSEEASDKFTESGPLLIVGIGASAGGLEAFQTFFRHTPEDSGMAFVLVSHLDPNHESMLSELLDKTTQMPVLQVQHETAVSANHVYVIPPNASLTIDGGVLRLNAPRQARGHRMPIDVFFHSLGEDQGENAVCVVLSGSGSDGTQGLKSVKEYGGLTITQDTQSAKYDSMPRSAVLTGLVDYILPVEEIPAKLVEFARHRETLRQQKGADGIQTETADYLSQICSFLRRRVGHDFSNYKKNTLIRRIQRRIQVLQVSSVNEYIERLRSDSGEVNQLFKDLLIGVTHFFRNPESFEALQRQVIPQIVEQGSEDGQIRVWVPGCSTGEEAYSIAILLSEAVCEQNLRSQIQIFATDIDERALETARQARYPENIAQQITPERLECYFEQQGDLYQVKKSVRELCIFSQHNLITDPPFSRLHLLSCRNLLIYFDAVLQKKLLPLFHYALKPQGYLFLGISEGLAGHSELFRPVNKQYRIFQHKQTVLPPTVDFPLIDPTRYQRSPSNQSGQSNLTRKQAVNQSIERVLLQDYAPSCVIVNDQGNVVYFFGRTGKYLEPSQGAPSNNIYDLARRGLRLDLRTALHRARETGASVVRKNLSVEVNEQFQRLNLIVRPMPDLSEDGSLMMVIFQDTGMSPRPDVSGVSSDDQAAAEEPMVQQLEEELQATKEHLQATIEELETSNEELKSANEELLSMNEELQSSNEELQTSKEEMQSINEELETVNSELRKKVEELDAAHGDLQNLFESTQIATIFLNSNLEINKFTPAATDIFRLIYSDIGRPITDIALRLEGVDLAADIRQVLRSLTTVEREVHIEQIDAIYRMRIMPYRTVDNVIDGAVMTFVDVTRLRQAQLQAETQAQQQQAIAELGIYAIQTNDIKAVSDRAVQLAQEILQTDLCKLLELREDGFLLKSGVGWHEGLVGKAKVSLQSQAGFTINTHQPVIVDNVHEETRFPEADLLREHGAVSGLSVVIYGPNTPFGVVGVHSTQQRQFSSEDITFIQSIANVISVALQREANLKTITLSQARLDLALEAGSMGVWEWDANTDTATWNETLYKLLGLDRDGIEQPRGEIFFEYVHPDDRVRVEQLFEMAYAQRQDFNAEFRINRADGELRWLAAKGRVSSDADGRPTKMIGINYDITDRKQTEDALKEADRRKDEFLATLGHELRNPLNALSNSIGLLGRVPDSARAQQLQTIMSRQTVLLSRLIDDLLDISRISYGKVQLQKEPLNLIELLQHVIADNQTSIAQSGLQFESRLSDSPLLVEGDATRLYQAFSNILRNAIKFSQYGDQVTICTSSRLGWVTVQIADTGIGMSADALTRVFTAFNQEDRSLSRSRGGLGLGLPLTKGIVELHHGSISADSAGPNQGTQITVELPLLADTSIPSEPNQPSAWPTSRPLSILIIEDHLDSATIVQILLEDLGHHVEVSYDGEQGLAQARQFKPDVVLSDIGLPGMSGYDLAEAIRADADLSNIYLVALSGYGQAEDKDRARAAGFDNHLTKPVNIEKLRTLLAERTAQQ